MSSPEVLGVIGLLASPAVMGAEVDRPERVRV